MLKEHEQDYKAEAWKQYSMAELGQWVNLLCKRAAHRSNPEKREKDLYDAGNYLGMMKAKLDELKG